MLYKGKRIFFSGIGGSGVSAIAGFVLEKGALVSGSDRAFDLNPAHPMYSMLKQKGIVLVPQDGSGITPSIDLAVFSTAVEPDRPEVIKVKELNIPAMTRPKCLAEIVSDFSSIAVAGTSGKSTASGLLAFLMQKIGMQPNFIGGGRVKAWRTDSSTGNFLAGDSSFLVIEACESDGTIVNYRPMHSIFLNLELDHHSVEETGRMFLKLVKNTSGMVILNADDRNLRNLSLENAVTFGIESPAKYKAEDIFCSNFGSEFAVCGEKMRLEIPGKYNIYNALSAISVLAEIGVPLSDIARALPEFTGIERRFDVHLNGKKLVIDDYAHNPHKIASLMQAVMPIKDNICYIFQPHGFGPTRMMKREYIEVFGRGLREKDSLILLPIFYQGGTASKDISSQHLADGIKAMGKKSVVSDRAEVLKNADAHENYVVMGARDDTLSLFAHELAERLKGER